MIGMRKMEHKEEPISPYNASGHLDLTPYYAVLSIVIKEKKAKKSNEKYKKNHKKKAENP